MKLLWTTSTLGEHPLPDDVRLESNPFSRKLTESEAQSILGSVNPDGLIAGVEPLTRAVLGAAPALRVVSRCGVGTDNIDLAAAEEMGIEIRTTPDAPVDSVAELTVGLILSMLRFIPQNDHRVRAGDWKGPKGNLLRGKCVAIIGCGRIGTAVAKLLQPFGVSIVGHDPFLASHDLIELLSMTEALSRADIVSLHVALSDDTRRLINHERIEFMKHGSWLVNTARGGLVDHSAIEQALRSGHLAGAALDVFDEEPYYGPLSELHNTVLVPHIGASAIEAREQMERQAIKNAIVVVRSLANRARI